MPHLLSCEDWAGQVFRAGKNEWAFPYIPRSKMSGRKQWGVRCESSLEGLRVPFPKFLIARKLFKLDTSVREDSKQPGLAYHCVDNIDTLISEVFLTPDADPGRILWGDRDG
jgi:hypothetical protein